MTPYGWLALAALASLNQSVTPQTSPRTAVISGIVADDLGAPVGRVRLGLMSPDLPGARTAVSDDAGRFTFLDLPAGRFVLMASKPPAADVLFGQKQPGGLGTPIRLTAGQQLTNLRIRLPRTAAVSGTIVDEHGAPVIDTRANATHPILRDGEMITMTAGAASFIDGRGGYRIAGLPAGSYVVATTRGRSNNVSITVRDGEERAGVNLRFEPAPLPAPTTTLAGTVTGPGGRPMTDVSLRLSNADPAAPSVSLQSGVGTPRPDASGRFVFPAVPAGEYVLVANAAVFDTGPQVRAGTPAQRSWLSYWVETNIMVDGHTPATVSLTLEPGVTLTGRVIATTSTLPRPADLTKISIYLVPKGPRSAAADGAPGNAGEGKAPDGSFAMWGVPAGRYSLRVYGNDGILDGWTVESAMLAGVDVFDLPFDVKPHQDVSGIVVTLTDRITELAGTLRNAAGRPSADATIIVFPPDEKMWLPGARRIRATRPDTGGEFSVRGLPAGDYLVATIDDVAPDGWFDPALLTRLRANAMHATVGASDTKRVTLTIR